jgi:hypothetical protein
VILEGSFVASQNWGTDEAVPSIILLFNFAAGFNHGFHGLRGLIDGRAALPRRLGGKRGLSR